MCNFTCCFRLGHDVRWAPVTNFKPFRGLIRNYSYTFSTQRPNYGTKNYWTLTYRLQKLSNKIVLCLHCWESQLLILLLPATSFLWTPMPSFFLLFLIVVPLNPCLCPWLPFFNHLDACVTFLPSVHHTMSLSLCCSFGFAPPLGLIKASVI